MPVTDADRSEILKKLNALSVEEMEKYYLETEERLQMHSWAHQKSLLTGEVDMSAAAVRLSRKEIELAVETMILYEAAQQGLSWWGRTKRRVELVKKYA